MASKASILPAVQAHYDTLRDDRTGDLRILDLALFVGVPIVSGIALCVAGFRMQDLASALSALAVFSALLFGLVIFVFQLRMQIKADGHEHGHPRLAELIDETFANVTYAVIVGVVTTAVGMIAAAIADKVSGSPPWITALLAALSLHLLLTILMCLKRIHSAYQQLKQS